MAISYKIKGKYLRSTIDNQALINFSERDLIKGRFKIPKGIIEIGDSAFNNCTELVSIIIPKGVANISDSAFQGCTGLTTVKMPKSLINIGAEAFSGCAGLKNIVIPKSVTRIRKGTFQGCGLEEIEIPKGVTVIEEGAFQGCINLTSIKIPDSVTSIERGAFSGCVGLRNVEIPNSVKNIGAGAFQGCANLTSVKIPESVTTIEEGIFQDCSKLKSIEIPDSVTTIKNNVFQGCTGLTTIKMPKSLLNIGAEAFSGCTGLKNVGIPNSVTRIEESAFQDCASLTSVEIPDSVKYISKGTFQGCTNLTSVKMSESITTIEEGTFQGCSKLKSITIPSSVTTIENNAFQGCSALTEAKIPDKLCNTSRFLPPTTFVKTESKQFYAGLYRGFDSVEQRDAKLSGLDNSKARKILNNSTFVSEDMNMSDFLVLMYNLGIFAGKSEKIKIKNDQKKVIEQSVRDVGFNILQKMFSSQALSLDKIHLYCKDMELVGVNEDFLRFLTDDKFKNLNDIIEKLKQANEEQEQEDVDVLIKVLSWFERRKSLLGPASIAIGEENRYKVLTYNQKTSSKNYKSHWNVPTVDLILDDIKTAKYDKIIDEESQDIANYFVNEELPYNQEQFDEAVELDRERREKQVPDHILGEPLKQDVEESCREYFDKTEKLHEQIISEANEVVEAQADLTDKIFTYEMLARSDKANFAMGFFTNCCAKLLAGGDGALRSMITDDRMQPLVIRNKEGQIIAFGIVYVNKEKGYAVVNDIEVNENYSNDDAKSKAIYEKAMQAIQAFVKRYNEKCEKNKQFGTPITMVTCGVAPSNWNEINKYIKNNPSSAILETPIFTNYNGSSHHGNWGGEQYVLWQQEKENSVGNGNE